VIEALSEMLGLSWAEVERRRRAPGKLHGKRYTRSLLVIAAITFSSEAWFLDPISGPKRADADLLRVRLGLLRLKGTLLAASKYWCFS
jgi:hypothetical protein